jgi:hypothetical protein
MGTMFIRNPKKTKTKMAERSGGGLKEDGSVKLEREV